MNKISNTMTQQQRLGLSAAQIQGLKILTLQAIQLEQRIEHEIEENPALEQVTNPDEEEKDTTLEDYLKKEEEDSQSYRTRLSSDNQTDNKTLMFSRLSNDSKTLSQTIWEQLVFLNLDEKQKKIAEFIIGTLDDDGYLRRSNQTISDDLIFTQNVDADVTEIENVIQFIQTLDPAGIAARSLQECLLIQLRRFPCEDENIKNALQIIENCYDAFVNRHYDTIVAKLNLTKDEIRLAIEEIVSLNPKPANGFSDGTLDASQSITPDFFVDYDDESGQFKITLAGDDNISLRINKSYKKIAENLKKDNNDDTKTAIDFITQKIKSAEWFIASLKQRKETLSKTMTAIVNYQKDLFISGDQSFLRPMVLKDIADITGYDVSTIWRVVDSKFVQTRFGIYSLKDFFSGGYMTSDGNEVSTKAVKKIIKTCIEEEDSTKPLTDQQIMDILHQKGYDIARRTIAKYREQLGLPVARLRKKL